MNENDPYRTPEAGLGSEPGEAMNLAGRGRRLAGAILDALVTGIPTIAIAYALGLYSRTFDDGTLPLLDSALIFVIGVSVFLGINFKLMYGSGQTVGKYLLGTRVVTLDGRQVSGNTYLFVRLVPMWAMTQIPLAGGIIGLVNALLIFRRERNCMHDDIAGTRVIRIRETGS